MLPHQRRPRAARLSPLDLPFVLELTGAYLDTKSHCACSLVSRTWNRHFAPFVYLAILANCNAVFARLSKLRSSNPPSYPGYRLEAEFVYTLDLFAKKFDLSSSPLHRRLTTRLDGTSYISFILLGWLSDNIQDIHLTLDTTPLHRRLDGNGENDANPFNLSQDFFSFYDNRDRIVQVLERSRRLVSLYLEDTINIGNHFRRLHLRWPTLTAAHERTWNGMLSNQPRWPNLRSVTLKRCAVDGQFVRILLLNCPVLTRLWFSTVTFEFPPSVPLSNRTLFDFQDTTFSESSHHDAADLMEVHGHTYPYPAIEELGFSHVCGISVFERLNFARQLPNLKQALFINGTYDISHRLPNVLPGFRSLERLRFVQLHSVQQPGDKHPLVALSPTTNLRDLELGGVFIQKDLSLAIRTHSIHLTNLEIENCTLNSEFIGSELMIHTLLGQCSVLKKFVCHSRNVPLYCDPDLFDRYLWASSNLEVLVVAPDCQARPETSSLIPATFTPEQAQEALFRRISSMGQLRELGFAGSVGTRSFFVEPHLDLLKGLHQLEVIDVSSPHLGGLQLTEQHADFMHLEWPKLRAVLGRPPYEYAHFTVQMLTHRPHVVVTHATKGPESRTDQLLHEIGRAEKWRGENE